VIGPLNDSITRSPDHSMPQGMADLGGKLGATSRDEAKAPEVPPRFDSTA